MAKLDGYRLNWRSEFRRLEPFLNGKGGVAELRYASEHAAPLKFNYLLKEAFAAPRNGPCCSLRVDHEWFTTRHVLGVLDEFDRLLMDLGVAVGAPETEDASISILKDIEVAGDMEAHIHGLVVNQGGSPKDAYLRKRAKCTFAAVKLFVESGGRLMIILNDMPRKQQTDFWSQIWNAGLAEAAGDHAFLVIHSGPETDQRRHHDSPEPDIRIMLPETVEDGSERDDHFFDDLIDAFTSAGVGDAAGVAGVHLENNRFSILEVNLKLSAAVLAAKHAQKRR